MNTSDLLIALINRYTELIKVAEDCAEFDAVSKSAYILAYKQVIEDLRISLAPFI